MLRISLTVLAVLAVPAAAQAQAGPSPTGTLGGLPLSPGSGCLTYSNGVGICGDAPAADINTIPPVSAAPGAALTVRFDEPVTLSVIRGAGTVTPVDATSWTFTLSPTAVGAQLVELLGTFTGPRVTGSAVFNGHVAVRSQSVSAARLTRSVARARVRVPAKGTVRAFVRVNGKRRSEIVTRTFSTAGERRLRLTVRRPGTAWLVTQYTFPGARPVEVSQRLKA